MKKKKYIFLSIFILIVSFFNLNFTDSIAARESVWNVTCYYTAGGEFDGGSCTTGGENPCSCPKSIISEN